MQANHTLVKAGSLINQLSLDKFQPILVRLLEGLTADKKIADIFSEKDVDKLSQACEMKARDLGLVFDVLMYLVEKMAYFKSQKQVKEIMEGARIKEELMASFFEVWKEIGEKYVTTIKKHQMAVDKGLKDFNWMFSMPLDYSSAQKQATAVLDHSNVKENIAFKKDIRAPVFEFGFTLGADEQGSQDETVKVQFDKVKLQAFFEELEKIQIKVDELTM